MRTKIFINWLWLSFAVSNLDDHLHFSQVWIILWVKFFKRIFCGQNTHFTWCGWDAEGSMLSRFSRVWLFGDPVDCSPPGSSVHGILQVRILEWAVTSFSRGSSQPREGTQVSFPVLQMESFYPLSQLGSHWRKPIINCQCLCILNFLIKTSEDYNRIQASPRQTSLEVQWLRCYTSTPRGRGSVPGWGTKIPNAIWCGQENFKT